MSGKAAKRAAPKGKRVTHVTRGGKKSRTKSDRAGLEFPVGRIARMLRNGSFGKRFSATAPVFLACVLEYLCAEVLELSGNTAKDMHKRTIKPRHLQLSIRGDEELGRLFQNVTIAEAGVVPHIEKVLMPQKKKSKGKGKKASQPREDRSQEY
jgi:histone H2A